MNVDDKSGSLLANTGDLAYIGEPLIIVTPSSILGIGRGPRSQAFSVLTVKGYLNK